MNSRLKSDWYTKQDINSFYVLVKRGDRIEFLRGLYSHFAVYVGPKCINGKREQHCIIHVTATEETNSGIFTVMSTASVRRINQCSSQEDIGKPYIETILAYLDDKPTTKYRINNEKDNEWKPLCPTKIVKTALDALERWGSYDVWNNNCEHFCNHCRYGIKHSDQSQAVATVAGVGSALAIAAAFAMSFLRSRLERN